MSNNDEAARYTRPELIATPDDYRDIFEVNRIGQKIAEDLFMRFGYRKTARSEDGINRALDLFEYQGQRNVIDFIVKRINQANGVNENDDAVLAVDE